MRKQPLCMFLRYGSDCITGPLIIFPILRRVIYAKCHMRHTPSPSFQQHFAPHAFLGQMICIGVTLDEPQVASICCRCVPGHADMHLNFTSKILACTSNSPNAPSSATCQMKMSTPTDQSTTCSSSSRVEVSDENRSRLRLKPQQFLEHPAPEDALRRQQRK